MITTTITELPKHHSGISMGYMVESGCLPNCKQRVDTYKEAKELAKCWDNVAKSQYH